MLTYVQSSTLQPTVWKCACIAGYLYTGMTTTREYLLEWKWAV